MTDRMLQGHNQVDSALNYDCRTTGLSIRTLGVAEVNIFHLKHWGKPQIL